MLLIDYLLIRLYGVVVWEYETIFNAKYFFINSKISAIYSCNPSAVLTCTCIFTQITADWRIEWNDRRTHIHTSIPYSRLIVCTMHTHISGHKWSEDNRNIYTHPYPYPRLVACTDTHTPRVVLLFSVLQERFLYTLSAFHAPCFILISQMWRVFSRDGCIADYYKSLGSRNSSFLVIFK